jgi:competence protein ComEC
MTLLVKLSLFALISAVAVSPMPAQVKGDLKIVFVDVEGGQATLFISPAGQSLLIDTGWPGNNGRDADRIVAAAKHEGIAKIDYVLLTHYHDDHVGGVPQLVSRMPVGTFIDHGPNREMDHGATEHGFAEYQKVLAQGASKRLTVRPGDIPPFKGMTVKVISADGELLSKPLAGAGQPNDACKKSEQRPADQTENSRSLGVEITFGQLKLLDLGDLTWDKERELMCPKNKLGHIDIDIVSHHGWYQSSSPALVYAIRPRIAIMDNGENKGGSPATFDTYAHAPGLETLWQLHYSAESGSRNRAPEYIANLPGTDLGYSLELIAKPDGSFRVFNPRTRAGTQYAAAAKTR